MDNLVRITRNITFDDLRSERKSAIDVHEEQINAWLLKPIEQLALDKNSFENGYAMLALELLFFEPNGKYLSGNTITGSGKCFRFGFNPFLEFLKNNSYIDEIILIKIKNINFYRISRCGIFHDMSIKSGLLIDSIFMEDTKVFYKSPINNGILVNPWNFIDALKKYFNFYLLELRTNTESDKYKNFEITFKTLFNY